MAVEKYQEFSFRRETLRLIGIINDIIGEYASQGYRLTVRQLYYQLVARDYIENNLKSYKRIVNTVSEGRLAGLIDWDAIEDRTREVISRSHWDKGSDIMRSAAQSFHIDLWRGQKNRVLVIVEKEALAGIMERICYHLDVPGLAARGYPSGTVLREVIKAYDHDAPLTILHLGDHDPSGIDMSRDLEERLEMFAHPQGVEIRLKRIALNMDQIKALKPPPNPAKTTDSRFADYRRKFGDESWELDALSPSYLEQLINQEVEPLIDRELMEEVKAEIEETKNRIYDAAQRFEDEE